MPVGGVIRVATYNVHACVGTDGRHDPGRVATVIGELDADVVALQEFTYPVEVALETRQPVVFTALDRYECALGPTRHTVTHCFGNAMLTRHPIVEVQRLDLSVDRREARGLLAATLDIRGARVHVLAAHLGLRVAERRIQTSRIGRYLDSVRDALIVVLGDFNDWVPWRSVVHLLDERFGRPPRPRSFPSRWPLLRLDRIWVHPLGALRSLHAHASPLARRASDHLPVVAEVGIAEAVAEGADVVPDGAVAESNHEVTT